MNKEQKEQIHKEFDEERAIWEKARDEFDGEIASLMDKSEYSNYIGSYHRQALKRFVGELALKYYKQGKGKASEIIDRHLYNLRFKKFDGRLDYELGLEKESNMLRQFEDVLEDGSVTDRIIKQIYDLPIDCDKCHKAGEPFCKCKDVTDHDCSLKEKGFCDCQKEEVEDSNFEALEDKATRWADHEHADSVDADGTCLECGAKNLI